MLPVSFSVVPKGELFVFSYYILELVLGTE